MEPVRSQISPPPKAPSEEPTWCITNDMPSNVAM